MFSHIFTCLFSFTHRSFAIISSILSIFPFFQKKKKYLKPHDLFCSLFKNTSPPRGYKHFVHFQKKFIEKFQAGESGIVLKPLNARLSTCILKNEQKKRTKKREKIKQSKGIQDGCLL